MTPIQIDAGRAGGHRPGRRPTVALLLDTLFDNYEAQVLDAIRDVFHRRGARLVVFVGGSFNSPYHVVRQRNILYQYIAPETVDGIICISGCVGNYISADELGRFLNRQYAGLPLVSIGTAIPGVPSVYVDNAIGMGELVRHFIEVHDCRRIGFIKGPEGSFDAQTRLDAYRRALAIHGIAYDENRVVAGDFHPESGAPAVAELLDRRKVELDALIAANDPMAATALHALKERGIRVPADIRVGGFDNVRDALGVTPTLTTVNQPTKQIGTHAAESMLALLRGEAVPERTELPTHVVIRRSCGCLHTRVQNKRRHRLPSSVQPPIYSRYKQKAIRKLLAEFPLITDAVADSTWAADLTTAFVEEVFGNASNFLAKLEQLLSASSQTLSELTHWHNVISVLAETFTPVVPAEHTGDLLRHIKTAYLVISEFTQMAEVAKREKSERLTTVMYRLNHEIITSFKLDELQQTAATEFKRLGLGYCFISLYSDGTPAGETPSDRLYPVTVVTGDEPPPVSGGSDNSFPVNQLIPGGIHRYRPADGFIVLSLFFKDEYLGIAAFDLCQLEPFAYEMLGGHLSAVLKGNQLLEETKAYAHNLEGEVAARTADLSKVNERLRQEIRQHKRTMQELQQRNETVRQLNAELVEKSKVDFLTNLYNREAFFELLTAETHRAQRTMRAGSNSNDDSMLTVMMIDIDRFKDINDTYGHLMGDQVVSQLGNLLSRGTILRQEDVAGRYGGEEFIIAMPRSDIEAARLPARRLMQQLRAIEFLTDTGDSFSVTISIGISAYRFDESDIQAVISRADRALYYAKQHGRNCIAVYEEVFGGQAAPDGD